MTPEQFMAAVPCNQAIAQIWHPAVSEAMEAYEINTVNRVAGFISQTAVESGGYLRLVENLDYSVAALAVVWPRRFATPQGTPNATAIRIGRSSAHPCDQQTLANLVYGGRFGNRPNTTDGWDYRGRGIIQTTFRSNYIACGAALGLPLVDNPDILLMPRHAATAAAWFWRTHGCNELMDVEDVTTTTQRINGGTTALEQRQKGYTRAKIILS